jgi:ribosomal protein L4
MITSSLSAPVCPLFGFAVVKNSCVVFVALFNDFFQRTRRRTLRLRMSGFEERWKEKGAGQKGRGKARAGRVG